jgi:hypothetical protein
LLILAWVMLPLHGLRVLLDRRPRPFWYEALPIFALLGATVLTLFIRRRHSRTSRVNGWS